MVAPVVTCEHCGLVFKIPFETGGTLTFSGSRVNCQRCGKMTGVDAIVVANPPTAPTAMPLPMKCQTCGNTFTVDISAELDRVADGQGRPIDHTCERCGGQARAEFGQYTYGDGGMQFTPMMQQLEGIRLPPAEAEQLLAVFLEALKNPKLEAKDVQAVIEKTPELHSLASAVPQTREELYSFIQAICTLLTMFATATLAVAGWRERRLKKKRAAAAKQAETAKAKAEAKAAKKKAARAAAREAKRNAPPAQTASPRKQWKEKKPAKAKR